MDSPPQDQKWRLFIALPVPDETRRAIAEAQHELRLRVGQNAASWTQPEQFHQTLKFLGSVRAAEVPSLSESLHSAFAVFSPVQVSCCGTGTFPNARRPRVIWAGLNGLDYSLSELHAAAEEVSLPFTAEKPETRFHAHVTIARVKIASPAFAGELARWAEDYKDYVFGKWRATEVALMKSQLSPKGASHSVVSTFQLRGSQ